MPKSLSAIRLIAGLLGASVVLPLTALPESCSAEEQSEIKRLLPGTWIHRCAVRTFGKRGLWTYLYTCDSRSTPVQGTWHITDDCGILLGANENVASKLKIDFVNDNEFVEEQTGRWIREPVK
jgi:hypothetical protein